MKEHRPFMKNSDETERRKEPSAITPETDYDKDQERQPHGPTEVGGPKGLEPTRYGDWEKGGRCIDF